MKLLKLEILNLASLDRQEGEVIDFENGSLKDCTIFSIVGPTGSGKSTILDAICLALYNRAPRYPKKKGDRKQNIEIYGECDDTEKNRLAPTDPRNILTHGKKHGYSKLTFLANNGTLYRAEWHVEFKTKKHGEAVTSLYTIDPGTANESIADWGALPQIIGLEYDQFLRTVLIAQGSFANFLNSNEQERYELLEKLIGNEDIYAGIAEKIKGEKDEAISSYNKVSAGIKAYEQNVIDSQEELDALTERINELEAESENDKKALGVVTEELGWYTREQKYTENIDSFRKALDEAICLMEKHGERAQRLQLHDATLSAVNLYHSKVTAEKNIRKHNETLENLQKDHARNAELLEEAKAALAELNEAQVVARLTLEEQKPHINLARKVKVEIEAIDKLLKERQKAVNEAETAYDSSRKAVGNNIKEIEAKTKEHKDRNEELENLRRALSEKYAGLLKASQSAESEYQAEEKKIEGMDPDTLQAEKRKYDNMLGDIKEGMRICTRIQEISITAKANKEQSEALLARNVEIKTEVEQLKIEQLAKELETLTKTHTLMTSENWNEHRRLLKEQKPCPLCGSTLHPYSDGHGIEPLIDQMNTLIEQKQTVLAQQTRKSQDLNNEKSKNEGKLQQLSESISSMTAEMERLDKEWHILTESHPEWKDNPGILNEEYKAEAEQSCKAADTAVELYNKTAKTIGELRKKRDEAKNALDKFNEGAEKSIKAAEGKVSETYIALSAEAALKDTLGEHMIKCEEELKNAQAAMKVSESQKTLKEKVLKEELGDKDPDQYEKSLEDAIGKAAESVSEKSGYITNIHGAIEKTKGMITATQKELAEEGATADMMGQQLIEWLGTYNTDRSENHLGIEDIAMMHEASEDWEGIRSTLKKIEEDYTVKKTTLDYEMEQHLKHQEKKPEMSKEELCLKKAEFESKSYEELVSTKARLQNHENAIQMIGQMADAVKEARQNKDDWEQITDAIGADGKTLRKIAQCYTLRFLIEHANDEIRKFNSRFELMQVKNSLGIRIIDHDRADDIRDTTSLSGGETFIVSLGMALGLSALSSRNVSFENLFIDEGFGTLDPETLATVIDSLSRLQSSQGKKVGVISHTDTMSERISTQIRIIKNGSSGSSHIEIWP